MSRPGTRGIVLAILLFAFDLVTFLPTVAGAYVVKRALRIDVVAGVDMLPDPLIEGLLAALAAAIGDG